jgi:hypothetical protein
VRDLNVSDFIHAGTICSITFTDNVCFSVKEWREVIKDCDRPENMGMSSGSKNSTSMKRLLEGVGEVSIHFN